MVRWLGLAALGVLLTAQAQAADWKGGCSGQGVERRCSVSAVHGYANNRGGRSDVTVTLIRDAACTTLHVAFDGPIALERPARFVLDGVPVQEFYTRAELAQLARALDSGTRPAQAPEAIDHFLTQVSHGGFPGAAPADEMTARFAALKEPRRLGLACAPTARLLPQLTAGRSLRVEFSTEPRTRTRVYHWVSLTERLVDIPLEGMITALDRVASER